MTSIGFLWVLNQIDFSPKKKSFIVNIKAFVKKNRNWKQVSNLCQNLINENEKGKRKRNREFYR